MASLKVGQKEKSKPKLLHRIINQFLWLFGTSRNAILVVITGCVGYYFQTSGQNPFNLIGYIPPGLPDFQPPPFLVSRENSTETFLDMVSNLGSGIIVVPLIALLENIAICKAFGKKLIIIIKKNYSTT